MALTAKVSSVSAPAATGAQADTSVGFQPQAMLFFYGNQTATGNASHADMGIGFTSTAAEDISSYYNSKNNVASTLVVRSTLSTALYKTTTAGATTANVTGTMTSLDATGFTSNFTATVTGTKFPYAALGGADITNAVSGTVASSTTTANFSVTGLGFQPDIVFLTVGTVTATGTAVNSGSQAFGVAKSSSARWCVAHKSKSGVATTDTAKAFYSSACLVLLSSTGATAADLYDFVSMDAGGFTLSHPTASASAFTITYLAIKGGSWSVGNFAQATSTGNQSVTGLGFAPVGVIFGASGITTDGTPATGANMSIGATDFTNQATAWSGDANGVATSAANSTYGTGKVFISATPSAGGTPTVLCDASIVSSDAGGFTINNTTTDASSMLVGYAAFGSNTTPPATPNSNFFMFMN